MPGKVFVITGPSGVGKGTLIRNLLERMPELELAVSATTRKPRPGEEHGVDYHFLDDAEFDRRVVEGDFLEHAEYSGRRYGTLRSELAKRTADGASVVKLRSSSGSCAIARAAPATNSSPSGSSLRKTFVYISPLGWTARSFIGNSDQYFGKALLILLHRRAMENT